MSNPTEQPDVADDKAQREALEQSEKRASKPHPENFKDEATDEKVVEIGPDLEDGPIKGIDPDENTDTRK